MGINSDHSSLLCVCARTRQGEKREQNEGEHLAWSCSVPDFSKLHRFFCIFPIAFSFLDLINPD